MAVKKPAMPRLRFSFGWRGPIVFILTFIGLLSLTGFMAAHWTERQVLTTDNWVKVVGPLPKNDQVATALSDYSVNQVFSSLNLEDKISQALPDKAAFLAPTLADRLQARTKNLTKNIIQSDQFETIWTSANQLAHQKLMERARSDSPAPQSTDFGLKLVSFREKIQAKLGRTSQPLFASQAGNPANADVNLGLNFKTKMENFRKFVKTTDFLNGFLGLFALVCLLGAIVLSYARRRLLLIISLIVVMIALLQLIGLNAVRPAILNHIENQSYRSAVGIVYDDLLQDFRRSAAVVGIVSGLIFVIAFLTRKKFYGKSRLITAQLKNLKQSAVWRQWTNLRSQTRRYRLIAITVVTLVGLAIMALVFSPDWQGALRGLMLIILAIELLNLLASRPRRKPM